VTYPASSLAKNATAAAISSGCPTRLIALRAIAWVFTS
jgi:hypothetical protein